LKWQVGQSPFDRWTVDVRSVILTILREASEVPQNSSGRATEVQHAACCQRRQISGRLASERLRFEKAFGYISAVVSVRILLPERHRRNRHAVIGKRRIRRIWQRVVEIAAEG